MPDLATRYGGPSLNVGSNPAASNGVAVTAAGSAHTKGSWVELIASTVGDTAWLIVSASARPAISSRMLLDIGIGAAASEAVLIPNLFVQGQSTRDQQCIYMLPIAIPAGTRISARVQGSVISEAVWVCAHTIAPTLDAPRPGGVVEAGGVTTASTAIALIDPGGTAHTDSAWVEIIASTGLNYKWLCAMLTPETTSATTGSWLVDLAIGAAASELALINDIPVVVGSTSDVSMSVYCLPCNISAGSRISARARSSVIDASDRIMSVAVWGVG